MIGALRKILVVITAACALHLPSAHAATDGPPPLEAYGDLPAIEDMTISPSGRRLAVAGRIAGMRRLLVFDGAKVISQAGLGDMKLRYMQWAGEDYVIVVTSATENLGFGFTTDKAEVVGAIIVPMDGSDPEMAFSDTPSIPNAIWGNHGIRQIDGKWMAYFGGLRLERESGRTGYFFDHGRPYLYALDLASNRPDKIANPAGEGMYKDWLVDADGKVAATLELSERTGKWSISNAGNDELVTGVHSIGRVDLEGFGRDGTTVLYSQENPATGNWNYFEVPLAGGTPKPIFNDIHFERLYYDHTNGRLLGYLEEGPRPKPVLFDPEKQVVLEKVYKAFPNFKVRVVEWTPDFRYLLVHTSGNQNSGAWYRVDMERLRADPVGDDRPAILPDWVGPISTFEYTASDGLELDGILTLPPGREARNLPVIMLPHGGPTSHDVEQFDWWAQAFASRGYAVLQPNFRGSTNRSGEFRRAGHGQWGRKMQSDVSDGLAALAAKGIVDPKRACIMGGSYGGYAALAGVTLQQGIYRCSVSVAGVSDLKRFLLTDYRESGNDKMLRRHWEESMGDTATLDEVSPRRFAERADAPILLLHGKDDTVVPYAQTDMMADALKRADKPHEVIVLREEDHWLSRSETRQQMLSEAMRFVLEHNPPD